MNRIRIGRPGARSGRPRLGALSPDLPGARDLMSWVGRRLWLAVRTVIRAVRLAHHEQVYMWECVLLTSGTAPLSAAGPLRWVPSLDGHRLIGSHLPA